MRATVSLLAVLIVSVGLACRSAAGPPSCSSPSAAFSNTAPSFVATVTRVTHETGMSPEGPMDQYAVWVAVSPQATAGLLLLPSTPVFRGAPTGGPIPSGSCAITVGDKLDVWHDSRWAFGAAEAPPGDTLYFATQVLIR